MRYVLSCSSSWPLTRSSGLGSLLFLPTAMFAAASFARHRVATYNYICVHTANDPLMSCMKNASPPSRPDFTFPSFQFHRRIRVMYSWHLLPSFRAALRRACFKINANEFGTKPLLTPGSCRSFSSLLLQRTYKKRQETSFKLDISN